MRPHGFLFFFLLVTTCSADSSDECCQAKTVGDVSYFLSRVMTDNDNFDMASDCINKCVYRKDGSTAEFCFKSGTMAVECKRMSAKALNSNSQMVTETAIQAIKKLTTELSKVSNYKNVKDKLDHVIWNFPDIPVFYNSTMGIFGSALGNNTPQTPNAIALVEKAWSFVRGIDEEIEFDGEGESAASAIGQVLDENLSNVENIPREEDSTVVEFNKYGLEAAIGILRFLRPESSGGENGGVHYFEALVAGTDISYMTLDILERRRGFGDSLKEVAKGTLAGAAAGCVGGAIGGPKGCAVGAAAGAIEGAVGGIVDASVDAVANACFSGDSLVDTVLGLKRISELRIGDKVRTFHQDISLFTEFLGWLDRSSVASSSMLLIQTQTGPAITLTGSHLIFSNSTPMFARELRTGDSLMHWNGSGLQDTEIVSIRPVTTRSFWAPLTTEGTLFVDGFLASCYASFSHQVSDLAFAPVKMLPRLLLDDEDSQHEDGVRPYVRMVKAAGQLAGLRHEQPTVDKLGAGDLSPFPVMAAVSHNTEL